MFDYTSHVEEHLARDYARQVFIRSGGLRDGISSATGIVFLAGAAIWAYQVNGGSWWVGMLATMAVVLLLLTAEHVPVRYLRVLGQVRGRPERRIRIGEAGLSIGTTDVEVTWPWHSIRAIREYTDYLMLTVGEKAFVCLPKAEMPEGACAYVTEHVWQRWRPPNNALERTRGG